MYISICCCFLFSTIWEKKLPNTSFLGTWPGGLREALTIIHPRTLDLKLRTLDFQPLIPDFPPQFHSRRLQQTFLSQKQQNEQRQMSSFSMFGTNIWGCAVHMVPKWCTMVPNCVHNDPRSPRAPLLLDLIVLSLFYVCLKLDVTQLFLDNFDSLFPYLPEPLITSYSPGCTFLNMVLIVGSLVTLQPPIHYSRCLFNTEEQLENPRHCPQLSVPSTSALIMYTM